VPDKLGIYNGALSTHLDTRPLRTLADARAERRALDGVYADTLAYMLEQHMWNFAARASEWFASTTATSEFGFRFLFEKPDDYVRLIKIADNENLIPQLYDYSEEGDFFAAWAEQIWVLYVSDDIAYGGDSGKWFPAFAAAFEAELAWRARGGVKPMSAAEIDALQKVKRRLLNDAKSKDVVNQPPGYRLPGRLVSARGGFGNYNRMRRTPYQ
jgi:hypothetical protein